MLGIETIRNISDVAAYRAAEEGRYPLTFWSERDARGIPFLGDYTPAGWRRALWSDMDSRPRNVWSAHDDEEVTFMVDSSGFGSDYEPALTMSQFVAYAMAQNETDEEIGWAIRESGQFQVVVGAYVRDPESAGNPAPDPADVECPQCGTIHNDLEECDEWGLQDLCEHEHISDDDTYPEGPYFGALVVRVVTCDDCGAKLVPTEPDEDGNVGWEVER